jgi:hypothetical protein
MTPKKNTQLKKNSEPTSIHESLTEQRILKIRPGSKT